VSSTFVIHPALYPNLPYDSVRDFTPIAPLASTPLFLLVSPKVKASNVPELIALAKRDPGKLNYSSSSSSTYLAGEMFKSLAGIDVTNIPYKGSAPSVLAVMTGDVTYTFDTYLLAKPFIDEGRLRLIAVSGKSRSEEVPSVPTVAEGGVPGYETSIWWGMFGPAGVPADIVAKLNGELKAVLELPDVKKRFEKLGAAPLYDTPENFSIFVKSELNKYETVVKTNKLKPAQ
jgi:tripartite-type tricarboxylate transporter receptor subunit TctC